MSITAWRIAKRKHAETAFDGAGARRYGGRWNSPGVALVYTSEHQSLAVLELLVHIERPQRFHDYRLIPVDVPDSVITDLDRDGLPDNWRSDPSPLSLRGVGNNWIQKLASAVLRVPSAIVPDEKNYLLNPAHPDFGRLAIGDSISFALDPRLAK